MKGILEMFDFSLQVDIYDPSGTQYVKTIVIDRLKNQLWAKKAIDERIIPWLNDSTGPMQYAEAWVYCKGIQEPGPFWTTNRGYTFAGEADVSQLEIKDLKDYYDPT